MGGRLVGLGFFLACVVGSAPLSAASFSLTAEETATAIQLGQRSVVSEEFSQEWRVNSGDGASLTVLTPFHRLALAARHAAFRNQTLKRRQIAELLRDHQGRLVFWATLQGDRADFARWYQPVLVGSGREPIKPSFVQNEHTALRQEDGRYLARCLYTFSTAGLSPKGRITLLIQDLDGRDVARFTVDLGAMR